MFTVAKVEEFMMVVLVVVLVVLTAVVVVVVVVLVVIVVGVGLVVDCRGSSVSGGGPDVGSAWS